MSYWSVNQKSFVTVGLAFNLGRCVFVAEITGLYCNSASEAVP